MLENRVLSNFDITLQWNADGVDTFKSSKVSMCPLQVAINELPYRIRKDNMLLAGLWCGPTKVIIDIFLKPFVDELRDLHENGIYCLPPNMNEAVNIKVHTILSPVDSVARCSLQNINQFNGKFGCSLCLHPGQHVKVRVFIVEMKVLQERETNIIETPNRLLYKIFLLMELKECHY